MQRRVRISDGMKARAYIVGDGPDAVLKDMARHSGFDAVYTFRSIATVEKQASSTPLIYFLFSAVDQLDKLGPVIKAIRASQNPRVRFAPMVYFSKSPSLDTIKGCINLGFDDIITRPFTLSRVVQRLSRQVDQPFVYYETPTYFGPDRRNRLKHEEGHARRGSGGQFKRMQIVRNALAGINVVSDESHFMV